MKAGMLLRGLTALALFASPSANAFLATQRQPNILVILADDLGYGELGYQGYTQQVPTPNIDSIATITAYGNDEGYDKVFVEPLRNFAQPGDVLIAISGGGNSTNILQTVEYANSVGCRTIGLTTADGGKLRESAQLALTIPGRHMGRLEDCFVVLTHIMAYAFIEDV